MNTALKQVTDELDERKKLETALRMSEERYRLITSSMSDYTFQTAVAADGSVTPILIGGAFATITGYSPEEYIAQGGWPAIVHPEDRDQDSGEEEGIWSACIIINAR